jgi:hypothetical protein
VIPSLQIGINMKQLILNKFNSMQVEYKPEQLRVRIPRLEDLGDVVTDD